MSGQMPGREDPASEILIIATFVLICFVAVIAYFKSNAGPINDALIKFNRAQLYVLAHIPGSIGDETAYAYVKLGEKDPWEFSFTKMVNLFGYVGSYTRWIVIPIIGCFLVFGFSSRQKVSDYYRRIYTMQTLLRNNIKEFPRMAPIANRKRSLLEEPMHTGKWKTVRMPIQFVAENKLLLTKDGKPVAKKHLIDRHGLPNERSKILKKGNNKELALYTEKARQLFQKQVGPKYTGTEDLPDYIKGLTAAFMAIGAGDKKAGFKLLNHMAVTFVEPENEGDPFKISIKGADRLIKKYKDHEDHEYHTGHHQAFLYPYLMALYEDHAKAKHGVLNSSWYIWLRPVDNLLFNILNQMGGREPWVEGAGAWNHYKAENKAEQSLMAPEVENAVKGLEKKMITTGWLPVPKDWQDE